MCHALEDILVKETIGSLSDAFDGKISWVSVGNAYGKCAGKGTKGRGHSSIWSPKNLGRRVFRAWLKFVET